MPKALDPTAGHCDKVMVVGRTPASRHSEFWRPGLEAVLTGAHLQ